MVSKSTFFGVLKRREEYEVDPRSGTYYNYAYYRAEIAEDCRCRCVYCDSHEDTIGGREAMQIDHFRPWNKAFGPLKERKFEHLKHVPRNLLHSCGVCNRFKSAHWPTDDPDLPHDDEKGWLDPFLEPRNHYLAVDNAGIVSALKPPGQYLIATLRLNRPLLKRHRELRQLLDAIDATEGNKCREVIQSNPTSDHAQTAKAMLAVLSLIRSNYPD